jgi:hypothetical protein
MKTVTTPRHGNCRHTVEANTVPSPHPLAALGSAAAAGTE